MGFGDPEDMIPGLIIIVAVLGLIGAAATFFPVIDTVPILNIVASTVHFGFNFLAELLTPFIPLDALFIAIGIEVILLVIMIIIIVQIGF